jgi:hypothetical protein
MLEGTGMVGTTRVLVATEVPVTVAVPVTTEVPVAPGVRVPVTTEVVEAVPVAPGLTVAPGEGVCASAAALKSQRRRAEGGCRCKPLSRDVGITTHALLSSLKRSAT